MEKEEKEIREKFKTFPDEEFGHNVNFDFLKQFLKLRKLTKIVIKNYYEIDLELGKNKTEILEFVLTKLPGCSEAKIKEKTLKLAWHF